MPGKSFLIFLTLCLSIFIAGCTTSSLTGGYVSYPALHDGGYTIPAIPPHKIAAHYRRQTVRYPSREEPDTIIVDTQAKYLYYILGQGQAVRYGIGVGRDGFRWAGHAKIGQKREWPVWTPPPAMIKRQPHLAKYAGGQKGGLSNPLGARALYLYKGGRDTLYRLHGTPEWWTIGSNVSSGCIRLMNHDIIDLYNRTKIGTKVIVH